MDSNKLFKLLINSTAKSKQEIQDEVRRVIQRKIKNVIEDVVKEAEKEITEKIPPRSVGVSYRSEQKKAHISADEIAYSPEFSETDNPLSDKIRRMRELGQTFHNGYMLRQAVELTIVKQGEFMMDVTDDFGRTAFCAVERPVYGALSMEQLRTYFTWRTDVRRGVYNKTDSPYVMLYCYELMNKIGVISSQDSLNRLIDVWHNCRKFCGWLDSKMPVWIKDFYAYNNIEGDYSALAEGFPIEMKAVNKVWDELYGRNYHNKLDYFMDCSSYNLKGSIFMKEEKSAELMEGALEAALTRLEEYFRSRDISFFELICGRSKKDFGWSPFAGAYVNLDRMDGFRSCRISSMERYCVKRGKPCYEQFEHMPYRGLVGYVLKAVEAVLRKRTGFRYGISANLTTVKEDFLNRDKLYKAVTEAEFEEVIPLAVNGWCDRRGIFPKPKERKKPKSQHIDEEWYSPEYGSPLPKEVEIDENALAKIRREADEMTRKLIIDDEPEGTPEAEQISELTAEIEDDVFEERTEQAALEAKSDYDFSSLSEEWRGFAEALDTNAVQILQAVKNGSADELCREKGLLPEAEFEQINDIALLHIGDVIIENGSIIEDYADGISQLVECCK